MSDDSFLITLKFQFPKSWIEFTKVAESVLKTNSATSSLVVDELPFDLAFGLLLRFFKENELEFDYNNLSPTLYKEEIISLFQSFEQVIGHYS